MKGRSVNPAASEHGARPALGQPRILDRVHNALRVRHYRLRTEEAYVAWIRRYIVFHGKHHPSELGAEELTAFAGVKEYLDTMHTNVILYTP